MREAKNDGALNVSCSKILCATDMETTRRQSRGKMQGGVFGAVRTSDAFVEALHDEPVLQT